ncbi:MAG: phospholipid carrier-dependent glycosyltransferase [Micrococcus sp.]|nr:phospholipid carrier-dependent glycosyltransferase [Micrococcus sp.]
MGPVSATTTSAAALRVRLGVEAVARSHAAWIVPLVVTLLAAVLRFTHLDFPDRLIFDETYYPKDAFSLIQSGYERRWDDDVNEAFARGEAQPLDEPSYVVHPPLGKWLIALGMLVFGVDNGYGWRSAAALAGTLSVLLTALIAQHLFRSVALGGLAGLFLAVEGHHLVMSRIGLLDIFLSFFVLAAFGALLLDRVHGRRTLARELSRRLADASHLEARRRLLAWGPMLWWRPWRLVAGLLLGAACSVKLSGLAFMAVFGLLTVVWDLQARRAAGIRRWAAAAVLKDGPLAFISVVVVGGLAYLSTWTGWLATSGGYYRQWGAERSVDSGIEALVPDALRSLIHYHHQSTTFHTGLNSPHDYASTPWSWPFMGRPVSYFYEGDEPGEGLCPADASAPCSAAITDIAHPLLWWSGLVAVLIMLGLWLRYRDWRAGALLAAYVAGQVVWFLWPERTMFFFYTVAYEPFLILMVVFALSWLLRPGSRLSRRWGTAVILAYTVAVLAVTAFFLPVWLGEVIPYSQWSLRMWFSSWV